MSKRYTAKEMRYEASRLCVSVVVAEMLRQAADDMEHADGVTPSQKTGKAPKRKWLDSGVRIRNVGGLLESICWYGGAMWYGKFRNSHFFLNQQMRTLICMVDRGAVSYPIKNRKDK